MRECIFPHGSVLRVSGNLSSSLRGIKNCEYLSLDTLRIVQAVKTNAFKKVKIMGPKDVFTDSAEQKYF